MAGRPAGPELAESNVAESLPPCGPLPTHFFPLAASAAASFFFRAAYMASIGF